MTKQKTVVFSILFFILALGVFLRFHNIETTPPGVYPDEAMNGEDAYKANLSGNYQLFYSNNEGREGLFMNLIALCFKFFGISILTLKLPAIIFGSLTIFGTYLLTKELFSSCFPDKRVKRIALISAFLTAFSFWAINFNRIAFRANMLPFILVFSFYFFFRGIRTKKWWDFAIGGLIFGVGSHTYIAFRIAPAIFIALVIALVLSRKKFLKEYWKLLLLFVFVFSIVTAPIAHVIYSHSEYLHAPIDDISIFSPLINHGHLVQTFLQSLFLSLIKYSYVGDMNWRHNYPPYPILDPVTGVAFLFGLIYALIKLTRHLKIRFFQKQMSDELAAYFFLITWFFLMLAPEFLTGEGLPHALRSIGTLPAVMILSALTFDYFLKDSEKKSKRYQKITFVSVIILLIFVGIFNPVKYFYFWANEPKVAESFDKNLTDISRYLKTLPPEQEKFVVGSFGPYHSPLDRLPIQVFNLDTPNVTYFYSWQNFDQIRPKTDNFIVILTGKDLDTEKRLQDRFPGLILEEIKEPLGSVYYILNSK
jgi:4-amino-4-deoxy-L-arabinose transferase-like glycosyltransferase